MDKRILISYPHEADQQVLSPRETLIPACIPPVLEQMANLAKAAGHQVAIVYQGRQTNIS